jgi:hypothetical protein
MEIGFKEIKIKQLKGRVGDTDNNWCFPKVLSNMICKASPNLSTEEKQPAALAYPRFYVYCGVFKNAE